MSTVKVRDTQEASTEETIQSLVNQVAQLKNDNNELHKRLTEREHRSSSSLPIVDPATAALVTPFSGKPGEDISTFFDDLLAAAKIGFWSDDQLLQMTKLRLIGEAKTHVLYNENLRNALTFEELRKGLLQRFKGQNSCRFFREQLSVLRQRHNEPLESFVDRIRKVNVNTYQLTNNDEANRVILQEAENRSLDTFLRGLPPDMSRRVRADFPKTLNDAVRIATALHEIDIATQSHDKRGVFTNNVTCFRCNLSGHVAMNCRRPQCTVCRKFGHTAKQCRTKAQQSKRSTN